MYLSDADKAADGSVSACAYDVAKLREQKLQYMMGAAIASFVHLTWGWTQPLLVMSVTQPLQLWDNKALQIHLFGKTFERPWAAPGADNPLAQWAERKKAEAQETQAVTAKKED